MEPLIKEKRDSAELIPYRRTGNGIEFYLQQRSKTAERAPGMIGLFGGGKEGDETVLENMLREIREELDYVPVHPIYFTRYESARGTFHVFIEEVGEDFESKVKVLEGDGGLFITDAEARKNPLATRLTRLVVSQVAEHLEK
jgi:8-oxo-dGTP pyrophosphatase MutT (NUDIX family)